MIRDSSIAFAFTKVACPLAWLSTTGLSGLTALSVWCVGTRYGFFRTGYLMPSCSM